MARLMREQIQALQDEIEEADTAIGLLRQNNDKLVLDNKVLRDAKDGASTHVVSLQTSHQGYKEGVQDVVKEILKALS